MEWLTPELAEVLDGIGFAAIALVFLALFVRGIVVPGAQCDRRYAEIAGDRDRWRDAYLALASARDADARAETATGPAALDALTELLQEARRRAGGA